MMWPQAEEAKGYQHIQETNIYVSQTLKESLDGTEGDSDGYRLPGSGMFQIYSSKSLLCGSSGAPTSVHVFDLFKVVFFNQKITLKIILVHYKVFIAMEKRNKNYLIEVKS